MSRLSVIVPVYKAEKYLHRCVASILAQTFTDFELILVDDGSPDESGRICDDYALQDPRVKVLHKQNGGVSSARNAGIDASSGEFVAFVDSDDYIAPQMYAKMFEAHNGRTDCLVVCECYLVRGETCTPDPIYEIGTEKIGNISSLIMSGLGGSCCNLLVPREMIGTLRFPEYLSCGEDFWFVLRLFINAATIVKIPEPLYYYYQGNGDSITHTLSTDVHKRYLIAAADNRSFLEKIGLFESLEKPFYWSMLRFKSVFCLNQETFGLYKEEFPEANRYVLSCPLLTWKMKILMIALNLNLDNAASWIVRIYRK